MSLNAFICRIMSCHDFTLTPKVTIYAGSRTIPYAFHSLRECYIQISLDRAELCKRYAPVDKRTAVRAESLQITGSRRNRQIVHHSPGGSLRGVASDTIQFPHRAALFPFVPFGRQKLEQVEPKSTPPKIDTFTRRRRCHANAKQCVIKEQDSGYDCRA